MEKLEKQPMVMKCFQNTNQTPFRGQLWKPNEAAQDFSIYYREENIESINKFLFKVQLKFPNFIVNSTQTLQEYF